MKTIIRYTALAVILLALPTLLALAQTSGTYDLSWHTVDGGGGQMTGRGYTLTGSVGQPDAASMSGNAYTLSGGFWNSRTVIRGGGNHIYLPLVLK